MSNLILLLCDQLSESITSLAGYNSKTDLILMCELKDEVTHVKHHKKKIAFWFASMRHFAQSLKKKGYNVKYIYLDDPDNTGSLKGEIEKILKQKKFDRMIITHPSEYALLMRIREFEHEFGILVEVREDNRFLCSLKDFSSWAENRKQLRMEYFYRDIRRKHNILMNGEEPIGGQWNYDSENRKPPKGFLHIPAPFQSKTDDITQKVISTVSKHFYDHFGDIDPFYFSTNRAEALEALKHFLQYRLVYFGDYQDAMLQNEPWMFHSHLSFYLNCGFLGPLECVKEAERYYHEGKAPLNAVEGFIRQIIGWREYVRGIYWLKMPKYASENFFQAKRNLPEFYWTAETHMNCLRQCILETKKNSYAHHIQRLMVLGNFALLTGIHPQYVNEWFLIVYADAYEWVELPNVSGMILFADGGYLASKPYAAGGAYIHKMSNYCDGCRYQVTKKNGPTACPFNYLYWDFLDRNQKKLRSNQRISMMYKALEQMDCEKRNAIRTDSENFLRKLENGDPV